MLKSTYKTLAAGTNDMEWRADGDVFLLGVNLEETDANDNPQPDSGSVWIQDSMGQDALSLAHGAMKNGQLSGFGCLPLKAGDIVKGRLWHARAGNTGKFNLYVARSRDLPRSPMSVNWQQSQVSSPGFPYGEPKLISVDGAADDTIIEVRPEDGYVWVIVDLWGYHDDGTSRVLIWQYYDGTTTVVRMQSASVASGVQWHLPVGHTSQYGSVQMANPVIHYRTYTRLQISALTAGKKIYARGLALEYAE